MPFASELIVGSEVRGDDLPAMFAKLFELVGASDAPYVSRTYDVSRAFELAQACARGEDEDPDEPEEFLGHREIESVPSLYIEGTCLRVSFDACPLSNRIKAAIRRGVEAVLLGDFSVDGLAFEIGEHDVFQSCFLDEPLLCGRYFVSISFTARGMPADPKAMLSQVQALAEFDTFRLEFDRLFGPSDVAIVRYD
jgi:hypothetical protein